LTTAAPKSEPSLDGLFSMVNCQVSWSVNNGYIPLNDVYRLRLEAGPRIYEWWRGNKSLNPLGIDEDAGASLEIGIGSPYNVDGLVLRSMIIDGARRPFRF
jgi:hypothetical protein